VDREHGVPPAARHRRPSAIRLDVIYFGLFCAGCLPDQQEKASIETPATPVTRVQATAKDTPVTIEFVGKTASSRRVAIRSRVEGFLASREYQEGTLVRAGQVIFQMDREPFEAQLQAAQAELAQQQAKLANKKAVAKKALDEALDTYRSSATAVEAAQAKVVQAEQDLGYTTIKSPDMGLSSFRMSAKAPTSVSARAAQ
jgi:membrane fusion protein (multidrug efflux system)